MRELTEEELKLAPCWATHYINKCFIVVFLSNHLRQIFIKEGSYFNRLTSNYDGLDGALKMPSKQFDITKHEWSDCRNLKCIGKDKGLETVCFEVSVFNGLAYFDLDKDDAIAIAKHFCLTAEDLK